MPRWSDVFKIFRYAYEDDALSAKAKKQSAGPVGVGQPDAMPDVRQDGSFAGGGGGLIRLRDSNDFIDLSTVANRNSRYKEYERLRQIAEIESVMRVIADEACIDGGTIISTPFYGQKSIRWLTENVKDPFLVYCWDFEKNDYTLGWAHDPRFVKNEKTLRLYFDDGTSLCCTDDHRILLRSGEWCQAGDLEINDELMPFYKIRPEFHRTQSRIKQFPRIFTNDRGWIHERQFIEEWRTGKPNKDYSRINDIVNALADGVGCNQISDALNMHWKTAQDVMMREGWSREEAKWLGKKADARRILSIRRTGYRDVFDLSVDKHENFCTESTIVHNCQKGENGHMFRIDVDNEDVKEELEWLLFNREMLNMDRKLWGWTKKLCIMGDLFLEIVIDTEDPKSGILKLQELPPDSVYRIETTQGRLVEFQQSKEGPDYQALTRTEITKATDTELLQATAIRFDPHQIVHARIGDDRVTFYPYGQSLIEPARGPAHQMRLMEDAMLVYRLARAPERRVFYIDVGTLPPFKAEAFIDRLKDQFRKKKVATNRSQGAGNVEERWHAPAIDEDYWVPVRAGTQTKIDTLQGAQNLGEVDDVLYFRNKLYTALNFPSNYFNNDDPNSTRITLSAQNVNFAKFVERIQTSVEEMILTIAERHLKLRGFPEETYRELQILMTPPSDWRELSRQDVIQNRITNANSLKGAMLLADYDILTKWMKYSEDESMEMMSRNKIQQLEQLKLQILAQNPQLLGVGVPSAGETEMGTQPGGPSPMLTPDQSGQNGPPGGQPDQGQQPPEQGSGMPSHNDQQNQQPQQQGGGGKNFRPLAKPSRDEIKKYDLGIEDYSSEQDKEEVDFSTV